jgi:hypothetical protein
MGLANRMDGRVRSLDGNRCVQVLGNGSSFTEYYPLATTKDADLTLKEFSDEFWGLDELTIDESKEQNALGTEFTENCRKSDIHVTRNEPERPNQHPAEGDIREDRRKWFRTLIRKRVPRKFRYCPSPRDVRHDYYPCQEVIRATVDISEYLELSFYYHVLSKPNARTRHELGEAD